MLERSPQVCGPPSKLCLDVTVRIKLLAVVSGHRLLFYRPCGFPHPPAHPPPTQSVIVLFCTLPCRVYPETALLSPQFPRAQREKANRRNFPSCLTLVSLRKDKLFPPIEKGSVGDRTALRSQGQPFCGPNGSNNAHPSLRADALKVFSGCVLILNLVKVCSKTPNTIN